MAKRRYHKAQPEQPIPSPMPVPVGPFKPFDFDKEFEEAYREIEAKPRVLSPEYIAEEKRKCTDDPVYFVNTYCQIYDNDAQDWIPFKLWPFQADALRLSVERDKGGWVHKRIVGLKTRQIGFTWLMADARLLWKMLFRPITKALVFSQSDEDAMEVLGENRFKGMYKRLPDWLKLPVVKDNEHEIELSNGCSIRALPEARGGDSRTVTDVVIDEADLILDLSKLITRAKPTLGSKGQMVIIGRAVKDRPNSPFKRLYLQSKLGQGEWDTAIFVPWMAHPGRTKEWYTQLCADTLALEGSLDGVHEMYPATDEEALQGRTLDKRIAPEWIAAFTRLKPSLPLPPDAPQIPNLILYAYPEPGRRYGAGGDPAGGLSDSDNSSLTIVDAETYQQVAKLSAKIEPTQFGNYSAEVCRYFNNAAILLELNNHGWAYLAQLKERHANLRTGLRPNGTPSDPGWMTSERSKNQLYDTIIKVLQDAITETKDEQGVYHLESVQPIWCDSQTSSQLASIDASTLSAPEGQHDDDAMSEVLALMCVYHGGVSMARGKHDTWGKPAPPAIQPAFQQKRTERFPAAFEDPMAVRAKLRARGIIR